MRQHILHGSKESPCDYKGQDYCRTCEGGLAFCVVCCHGEGDLTTECPGSLADRPSAERWAISDAVMSGFIDFRDGQWVRASNDDFIWITGRGPVARDTAKVQPWPHLTVEQIIRLQVAWRAALDAANYRGAAFAVPDDLFFQMPESAEYFAWRFDSYHGELLLNICKNNARKHRLAHVTLPNGKTVRVEYYRYENDVLVEYYLDTVAA